MAPGYFSYLSLAIFYLILTVTSPVNCNDIVLDFQLDCRVQWVISDNTYVSGGTLAAFITTVEDCKSTCEGNTACVGAVINNNVSPIQCWIIKSADSLASSSSRQGYQLYEITNRCDNQGAPSNQVVCTDTWTRRSSQYRAGGQTVPSVTDQEQCLRTCLANFNCVMFAVQTVGTFQCILYLDRSFLTAPVIFDTSFQEYELIDRCINGTGRTTLYQEQADCNTWIQMPAGVNSQGASFQAGANSVPLCQAYCISNPQCIAIDFDNTGSNTQGCWYHTDPTDLTETFNTDQVTQYRLQRGVCATTTAAQGVTGQCATWTMFPNVNSLNANFAPNQNTVALCQAFCLRTSGCVAIDFDHTGNPDTMGCWYHTTAADLINTYDTENVDQYRYSTDCATTGSSATTTTAAPGVTGQCATWTMFPNTNSLLAQFAANQNTVALCQAFCLRTPGCVAIDFDHTGNPETAGCWYHTNAADLTEIYDTTNVDQYRLSTECTTTSAAPIATGTGGQCANWIVFTNFNSLNAFFAANQNTVDLCKAFCLRTPGCVAIDFDHNTDNPATNGCWYHTNSADLQEVFETANVDQYRFTTECLTTGASVTAGTGAICATWTTLPNTNSINGNLFALQNSVAACQAWCIADPTCVAVDFDHTGVQGSQGCWVHNSAADLTETYVAQNVDQYRLSRTCTTGTTAAPFTGTAGQCVNWSSINASNSVGAVQFAEFTTLADCQAFCVSQPACVAVEWDTSTDPNAHGCWVHTDRNNLNTLYEAPAVTQYRLDRTCQSVTVGPPVTGGICNNWQGFPAKNSINGIPTSGITTLAACQDACIANPSCVALEFDTNPAAADAQCWLHLDPADLIDVFNAPDTVTQYRLTRECVTTQPQSCVQFRLVPLTFSANGLPYLDIDTPPKCTDLCASLPTCVACDFDYSTTASAGCWIHENPDDLTAENTFNSPTVDQYIADRSACSNVTTVTTTPNTATTASRTIGTGTATTVSVTTTAAVITTTSAQSTTAGCRYTWASQNNTNIDGGIPTRDITVESCRQRCISRYPCFAIDIDYNVGSIFCWIHITQNPTQTFTNVIHMTLTRDPLCPETITTTSTTSTTTPTTTTAAQTCYFKILQNANSNGGTLLGKMSLDDCVQSCRNQYPYCVAVDHRSSDNSCYLQTSLSGRQWNTCCTRYEIYCTSTPCTDGFVMYPNRAPASQGSPLTSATSLDACQQACLANTNCQAFAWGVAARFDPSQKCYLTIGMPGTVSYSGDFNFYVRQTCSGNQLFTTATTTPAPTPSPGACVLDIVFVVDISGSVSENAPPGVDNLALIRQFLRNIIQPPINIGTYLDHVGLVVFESSARTLYTFNDPQNVDSFTFTAINGIPFPAGETNTPAGLDLAYNVLVPAARTAQPIVMLITDGQTTQDFRINLAPSIQRLVNAGTTRIAIGVTDAISMDDLRAFATDGTYVTTLQSFQQLESVQSFVINSILVQCNRPTIPNPGESTVSFVSASASEQVPTTTGPQLPDSARQVAFSVSRSNNQDSTGRVSLPTAISNYNNHFDVSAGQWSVQASGIYFVEACAGLQAGRTAELRVDGAGPTNIGLSWESTIHNGVETACRAGLIRANSGATISLVLDSGSLYSSQPGYATMFTGFSVSDTITSEALSRVLYAVMTTPPSINGPVSLRPAITPSDSNSWDGPSGTYRCQMSAPHIVSVSLGVAASTQTIGLVRNDALPVEVMRNSQQYNGVTTLARTVVFDCSPGRTIQLEQVTGSLVSSTNGFNYTLTSLTIIPFQPKNLPNGPCCWQAYKAYIVDTDQGEADPFLFNNITVNTCNAYDGVESMMIAPYNGYYFLSFSVGSSIQKPFVLSILRNEDILYRIEHQVTSLNQEDMYSHSVVALLNQGDTIRARGEFGGSFFSGVVGYQSGFGGCLLYTV